MGAIEFVHRRLLSSALVVRYFALFGIETYEFERQIIDYEGWFVLKLISRRSKEEPAF